MNYMITKVIFNPKFTRKELLKKLKPQKKVSYNRFRWWRMYESKTPLSKHASLKDRIINGDFDYSHYSYQAELVEHDINDLWESLNYDNSKFTEQSRVMFARRKKLLEDFDKDEKEKLANIYSEFTQYFRISKEKLDEIIWKFEGDLLSLYNELYEKRMFPLRKKHDLELEKIKKSFRNEN